MKISVLVNGILQCKVVLEYESAGADYNHMVEDYDIPVSIFFWFSEYFVIFCFLHSYFIHVIL